MHTVNNPLHVKKLREKRTGDMRESECLLTPPLKTDLRLFSKENKVATVRRASSLMQS